MTHLAPTASGYGPDVTIVRRFCGPPSSGNGGYTSGLLADLLTPVGSPDAGRPAVEVSLRQPPPLDVPMKVQFVAADDPTNVVGAPAARFLMGGAKIAEAAVVELDIEPVAEVRFGEATAAQSRFPGLRRHPFPTCFVCGPDRDEGDGLRIFPGPVDDERVAATWVPDASLVAYDGGPEPAAYDDGGQPRAGVAVTWAALDCIGGWAGDLEERKMVLGRMTAQIDALPAVGEPHVVVGRSLRSEGRKTFTTSTLYDSDDRIVARATHVWIAIDPSSFA